MTPISLPIDSVLPEVVRAVQTTRLCVLKAPTGAGKTTRVASALLASGCVEGQIVLVEPRRLAARTAARRIAEENGKELGREVGYRVRFDNRSCPGTRILCVTDGMLVRMLQEDPFLDGVSCVVFDEFHERSLDADLSLAMVRRVREETRDDLGVVVMSATFDVEPVAQWLNRAPIVESPGRLFPVERSFLSPAEAAIRERDIERELLPRKIRTALSETEGHVLVFLAGVPEIRRAAGELESLVQREQLQLFELYGDLSPGEQDRALAHTPKRKLILATNVAETSITIEGVTAVVDTGKAKRLYHEPGVGLDRLRTERISRASADQRAGRAGRTGPGRVYRFWTEQADRTLEERERPEIARVDLSACLLELAAWGETDPQAFPWFEAPPPGSIERGQELLQMLGAIQKDGRITALGRELSRLPIHPRLARLILAGRDRGATHECALVAALLSERDPFRRRRVEAPSEWSDSDLAQRVQALHAFEDSGSTFSPAGELTKGGARAVLRVRDQLLRLCKAGAAGKQHDSMDPESGLAHAILAAFPDRVCRRRDEDPNRAVMVGGRGVRLANECTVRESRLFVAVEIRAGSAESLVIQASAIDEEWLDDKLLEENETLEFLATQQKVEARRELRYRDLVLSSKRIPVSDVEGAARVLAAAAGQDVQRALDLANPETAGFLARARFLSAHCPELELPSLDEESIAEHLPTLCMGKRSFAELRAEKLTPFLKSLLGHQASELVRKEAPETVQVPSGSKIRLDYSAGSAPVLAVRIQEVFGLAETPRVARGKIPVLMHLLAPNMRPQQVTDDLRSFWNSTYALVRKELRRRYPKHSWPEDPWNAKAIRGTGRRR